MRGVRTPRRPLQPRQPPENGCHTASGRTGKGLKPTGTEGQGRLSCAGESPSPSTPPEAPPLRGCAAAGLPSLTAQKAAREAAARASAAFTESYEAAVSDYLAELRREGRAAGTLDVYRRLLADLGLFLHQVSPPLRTLADVTPERVFAFRDHEIGREKRWCGAGRLAANTLSLRLTVLRGFFRHLSRRGFVLLDPALDLKGPRRPRRLPRDIPTPRQMKRLLFAPDPRTALGKRDRAVLELLYSSGLRNAELCGLLLGDVDLTRRTVFVRKGKGGKERLLPMGREAARALNAYLAVYPVLSRRKPPGTAEGEPAYQPLFLTRTGGPLRPGSLRYLVAVWRERSHLSLKTTPHSLRHACATHLLKGGAGIRQIQALLGHSSLESTQIYTKVETSDLKAMLDRHHPRGHAPGAGAEPPGGGAPGSRQTAER